MNNKLRAVLVDCFRLVSKVLPSFAIRVRLKAKYQHEKAFFEKYFVDFAQSDGFDEKFKLLKEDFDQASIDTLERMVTRYNAYFDENRATNYDLFSKMELLELKDLQINFHNKTEKISDNLYRYKDYLFPVRNFEPSVLYYNHGVCAINSEHLVALHEKSIIDVGGFIGDSIVVLNELEPKSIYSFEAIPYNFDLLQKTVTINKLENVIAENYALGSRIGTTTMSVSESISTIVEMGNVDSVLVNMTTLDDYVKDNKVSVGLIKVDIEGAETDFLKGAVNTIKTQKPVILLSIYHNTHDFLELKAFIKDLQLGYTFKIYKPTDGAIMLETLLVCQV